MPHRHLDHTNLGFKDMKIWSNKQIKDTDTHSAIALHPLATNIQFYFNSEPHLSPADEMLHFYVV